MLLLHTISKKDGGNHTNHCFYIIFINLIVCVRIKKHIVLRVIRFINYEKQFYRSV